MKSYYQNLKDKVKRLRHRIEVRQFRTNKKAEHLYQVINNTRYNTNRANELDTNRIQDLESLLMNERRRIEEDGKNLWR